MPAVGYTQLPVRRPVAATADQTIETALSIATALLEQERVDEALEVITRCRFHSVRLDNARGVCLLRKGHIDQALVMFFRNVIFPGGESTISRDAPTVFQTNYVAALLVAGKVVMAKSLLPRIQEQNHPSVVRMKEALRRWKKAIGFVGWIRILLGAPVPTPVLDYAPGDL